MLEKIIAFVREKKMLEQGDRVVIGVSGGADSVCLFLILLALQEIYQLTLFVVHVNHGIRGLEANEDQCFVERLCEQYKIPCKVVEKNVPEIAKIRKISEEEAGRSIRYEAFYQTLTEVNADKIAVAHNQNDQAETVLLHLIRGSGLKGMGGIPPQRGEIIRPLLLVSRAEIEAFLENGEYAYRTDSSNLQEKYTRNKIRLKVLPYLSRELNQKAVLHITKTAGMLREAEEYIEKNTQIAFEKIVKVKNGQYSFKIEKFSQEDIVIKKALIRKILFGLACAQKDIDTAHIEAVLELIKRQVGKQIDLPYGITVKRAYEALYFERKEKTEQIEKEKKFKPIKLEPPCRVTLPYQQGSLVLRLIEVSKGTLFIASEDAEQNSEKNLIIPKNSCTKWFDYDKIVSMIVLRRRETGDYFQQDAQGHHKKLKSYFIDEKIPQDKREEWLLIAEGNHILWILGNRMSEYYKVSKATKRILEITIDGGTESDQRTD